MPPSPRKPLSPAALQAVASFVLPPAQAQLQGSEQTHKERKQLSKACPRLAALNANKGARRRLATLAFDKLVGDKLLEDAHLALSDLFDEVERRWSFESARGAASFSSTHLHVEFLAKLRYAYFRGLFQHFGQVVLQLARYNWRAGGRIGPPPSAARFCPAITSRSTVGVVYKRTAVTSTKHGRVTVCNPVNLAKQKGLGDVESGLSLDLNDPTMFQFAYELALQCWEELLPPIRKSFKTIYGGQAAGANGGAGRMKSHNARQKKGTSGKRVPLAHIANHGDADFIAQPFHDEDFSTGDRKEAATADSKLPKSCSLALVATGLHHFDEAHTVVDLIEDATITSCGGWQRPNRILFEHSHGEKHVGRVKKLFSPEGLLSNQVTQDGIGGLPNVLGWLGWSKISLLPTFVDLLGVTPRCLGVSIQRNDYGGQLKELLWAMDLQGKCVEMPSTTVNDHFYHTNQHLSKVITLLFEYQLEGCLPGNLRITNQEIQQAKETLQRQLDTLGRAGVKSARDQASAAALRVKLSFLCADKSNVAVG
ncbi:hypothetical protein Rhopal_005989-T1 [Rhodotorula paludigena]|uniref:Uncharacterized protein n=1 Tax=Rhodotorula paludigena TaxID=86838 RepID=A0AAV5GJZ6_9BASI|nr:hypothetical protein Rhopal_005989-T1 [Rhodotorula paludigena]